MLLVGNTEKKKIRGELRRNYRNRLQNLQKDDMIKARKEGVIMDKKIPYEKILEYANQYANREKAMQAVDYAVDRVKAFKPLDLFLFHSALVSFGVLVGTTLANCLKKYKIFLFLGFLLSSVYLIFRIFKSLDEEE